MEVEMKEFLIRTQDEEFMAECPKNRPFLGDYIIVHRKGNGDVQLMSIEKIEEGAHYDDIGDEFDVLVCHAGDRRPAGANFLTGTRRKPIHLFE
jgi:hypothetical protein